ncbi:MAG: hypothetical protein CR972_01670 [Candidatus Moraniibacteriota bacterium]|nr:MAG: hypothetical protein CR972_01670 [Candidatus Moranbacteria bacterium]
MANGLSKKRLFIYITIFVALAFFIVYFTQKKTDTALLEDAGIPHETTYVGDIPDTVAFTSSESLSDTDMAVEPLPDTKSVQSPVTSAVTEDVTVENVDQKVIKTGEITMHVNSIAQAIADIKAIALSHDGNEVASNFSKNSGAKQGFIVIKVPVNQYGETFVAIKNIAPLVTHESSHAQDVTAQFIDLKSRIENKKEHENRLRTFFHKADDVDELIQVERELARVRTEIEQMEGQLKYLTDQTQYSTIHVTLLEDENIVISEDWRPMQVIKDSFNTLIKKSTNLFNAVIRFTITSLPFIILIIIAGWFLHFTAKHIFEKKTDDE